MDKYKEVYNVIQDKVVPSKSKEAEIKKELDSFLKILKPLISPLKVFIGGSYAKKTWLNDIKDIDLYIVFEKTKEDISKILYEKIKTLKNLRKVYGSRDYFQVDNKKLIFEIIPIMEISKANSALNITDISPLHVKWVDSINTNMNEARILKQFLKANNLYGAESHIKGFSGYVCEILIGHYKTFHNLILSAQNWKNKEIIDPENHYQTLNKSKVSALNIIDPVQKERNAGAAIDIKTLTKFKELTKKFLDKPSLNFFNKKIITKKDLEKKYPKNKVIFIQTIPLIDKPDIAGAKLLKGFNYICTQIKKAGFNIINKGWDYNSLLWIVIEGNIEKSYLYSGPKASDKIHAKAFKNKHKGWFLEDGFIKTKIIRKYSNPILYVKELIKEEYINNKVNEINIK